MPRSDSPQRNTGSHEVRATKIAALATSLNSAETPLHRHPNYLSPFASHPTPQSDPTETSASSVEPFVEVLRRGKPFSPVTLGCASAVLGPSVGTGTLPWGKLCTNLSAVRFGLLILVPFVAVTVAAAADRLASSVTQLVVGIAPDWDSMMGKLQRFDKTSKGWEAVGPAVPVLFGKHGLAWGRGELVGNENAPVKVERDNRAPAGVFQIGTIYTYDKALPVGANYPFHTVGPGDAWVDDLTDPNYNRHVLVDAAHPPSWFEKNKMRRGDFAYRWLVEIRHNTDPPVPGYGSAIFFHIRRGPLRPSAGCTTMAESDLVQLIRWLRIDAHPRYVCLPKEEYLARWNTWGLPEPRLTDFF